ncbi:hypothetical protein J4G08_17380 [Candidatus Poribacteria bacterium]|nr:hypothetical protein [Candidatus Poribacteria bacterium]
MRYLAIILFSVFIISGISPAEPSVEQASRPPSILNSFFKQHLQTSSLQFSVFSYKPELGDLTNILQSVGIPKTPVAMMPTLSIVLQHMPELDSRLEIGYWRTQLDTPPPTATSLTATLMPISYQLIYRPVLLYRYLPIYFGGGIGFLKANFDGNIVDVLAEQGISLNNSASATTGYVIAGIELFQWESQPGARASIGNNASINFELKRILKTIETTGDQPFNIILDGTAIGVGVRTQF